MNSAECKNDCCSVAKCDIFDFMAKYVGLTIIHPGGLKATQKLAHFLRIDENTKVIDIACGKGSTAFYLAKKYNCNIVGIDISEELIDEARYINQKKGLEKKVIFQLGDAMQLPFSNNEFDVAISQAMLVLVDDKIKTIKEADRVIKNGGRAGWLELSWRKEIDQEFLDKVSNVLCAYCMMNVSTYDDWETIFENAGINKLSTSQGENVSGTFFNKLKEEGIKNTIKIMFNTLRNKEIRERISLMNKFFKQYNDYFGYGIYYYQK